jgi:protein SCO1/2
MRFEFLSSVVAVALVATGVEGSALAGDAADPHAKHRQMMNGMTMDGMKMDEAKPNEMKRATRSTAAVALPKVTLVRSDGKAVVLADELNDGRPVVLNFIFTTCTTICPVMSQIFSQLQDKLEAEHDKVHLVSISIDPEQDTPARLTEYARKFKAGPDWQFFTGTTEASVATQRAFTAFRGDKMDHTPVTFLRVAPGRPWVRIDGFATSAELAQEFHDLVAAR